MKKTKRRRRMLLIIVIGIMFILFVQSNWMNKYLYPIKYKDYIAEQAEKQEIDPFLIAAVIKVESNFQTGRSSSKGAIGLMQLMPSTADWIVQKIGSPSVTSDELLHLPEKNIELGAWYLNYLLRQFDHEMIVAIAAYNAGPGNVNKWLKEGVWNGELGTSSDIPFGETRHYVQKVIYYYNKYKDIHSTL